MKPAQLLMALLLSFLSITVHAAGSAMNEDFTNLIALSKNAIEAGKNNDAPAFLDKTNLVYEAYNTQERATTSYSIHLPRAGTHIKAAVKEAKAGNTQKGITELEEAITEMQKK